jgi:adenylate kinase family enzyme
LDATPELPIGRRIAVIGTTSSGKSTLGARLAELLEVPFVELDALFWKPGWVESSDEEFFPKIVEATSGDEWVVAGSYSRTRELYWSRLDTVIWLDLPLALSVVRIVRRSWRRSRNRELLWGTNYERFWPQLKVWSQDSLINWAVTSRRRARQRNFEAMADPRWSHLRWLQFRSQREVDEFVTILDRWVASRR